jgi:23S rRNA pseudouridine1911/1915/1917 synthase
MQESNQELFDDFEEELYEHYRFEAGKGQSPLRVDKFLMNLIENATRNKIQQAAANGNIYVNDVPVKSNHKVKSQDVVRVLMKQPPFENIIIPENIQLNIVYEDDYLLVVNKTPGLVVHPGHGNYTGTLVNALAYHFDNLPLNSSERPGLVHRIDIRYKRTFGRGKNGVCNDRFTAPVCRKVNRKRIYSIGLGECRRGRRNYRKLYRAAC